MLTESDVERLLANGDQVVPQSVADELTKPWADIETTVRSVTTNVNAVRLINRRLRRRHLTALGKAAKLREMRRLRQENETLQRENAALREQLARR